MKSINKKCFIVSNRLPIEYDTQTNKIKLASGGLVSALSGLDSDIPTYWVGSLINYKEKSELKLSKDLIPIFFDKEVYNKFYNNISNDVFWPLFHYEIHISNFSWDAWESYKKVNLEFAKKIAKLASVDDLIWIHDYHLFLVPQYLKQLKPNLKIGFFLHIPFPSSEIFKILPIREEILSSLLHCSLVGFHDYNYLRHFVNSLHFILGLEEANVFGLNNHNYHVEFGVFPVSINTQKFLQTKNLKEVINQSIKFKKENKDILILGVDRLDYTKGIELKLTAFETLLEKHPELQGHISLLQIAVPSRTDVDIYNDTKNEIDRLIGSINGRFGKTNYVPIKYMFKSVSFKLLVSLYKIADLFIITSKRDGMNLVSLEYIASQDEKNPGVLLLSEFTGAISNLSGAIAINPWNIKSTVESMYKAIMMPRKERIQRYEAMIGLLKHYDASIWASDFLKRLEFLGAFTSSKSILIEKPTKNKLKLPHKLQKIIQSKNNIILFLDYDGTLTPIIENPEEAVLSQNTISILETLNTLKKYIIHIVSGRPLAFLKKVFKNLDVYLSAEHGGIFYDGNKAETLVHSPTEMWMSLAKKLMMYYTKKVVGSFIEEKQYSISWHYRNSPPIFAAYQARILYEDLGMSLKNHPVTCINGKKIIEVKALESNKGFLIQWFLKQYQLDNAHIIAIGDDVTDEDMFQIVNDLQGISIYVGNNHHTNAQYYLKRQEDIALLLKSFIK